VWDLDSGRELRTLEGHSGGVTGVAVTPDGKRAVSASFDETLKVWDLETGRALRTLEGHSGFRLWRGGDAGREAGGFRVFRRNAEGVGPGLKASCARWKATLALSMAWR
jgi:hypothetical protein